MLILPFYLSAILDRFFVFLIYTNLQAVACHDLLFRDRLFSFIMVLLMFLHVDRYVYDFYNKSVQSHS